MIRKTFRTIKFFLVFLLSLLTAVSYFQSYLPPSKVGILSFLGFAFPYLWLATLVVLIVMFISRSFGSSIVSFAALASTFCGMADIIHWGALPVKTEKSLKVLTFNVCNFHAGTNGSNRNIDDISAMCKAEDADIVCLQEVGIGPWFRQFNRGELKSLLRYRYVIYDHNEVNLRKGGGLAQVILSRYPLSDDKSLTLSNDMAKRMMSAIVNVNGTKVRVVNIHLASIGLSHDEIGAVDGVQHAQINEATEGKLKSTYRKMKEATLKREKQVDYLLDHLKFDMPTIVCGDFNDIPTSSTYHRMTQCLNDTFDKSAFVLGDTYNGSLPPIRIDYILHSDKFKTCDYRIVDCSASDHYPVSAVLALE